MGVTCCVPLPQPQCEAWRLLLLLPLEGSELGKGEKWKNVFKRPQAHELSPVWGVSSLPPSPCRRSTALQGCREEEEEELGNCSL